MKYFLDIGNRYAAESDWKDYALVKFCLCAVGIMIGVNIPKKNKRVVERAAFVVFIMTYIPLMCKLFKVMRCGRPNK